MSGTRYDPFKDESLGAPRKRKPPTRIDWRGIARRMAGGETPREIAAALGLAEDRIWRHLNRSPKFLKDLDQETRRQRLLTQIAFHSAGPAAAYAHLSASSGEDTARWLAEQTGLAGNSAAPDGEEDLAQQLRETARSTRRAAMTRPKASAAEIAEHAAWLAAAEEFEQARKAASSQPVPTATDPDEPQRTRMSPDEPERTRTNLNEPGRTRMNLDEPPGSGISRPPAPPPRPPLRTIVDLDGPDLARLKESGALPP